MSCLAEPKDKSPINCPWCEVENKAGATHCYECKKAMCPEDCTVCTQRYRLDTSCPKCGNKAHLKGSVYCMQCGHQIGEPGPSAVTRMTCALCFPFIECAGAMAESSNRLFLPVAFISFVLTSVSMFQDMYLSHHTIRDSTYAEDHPEAWKDFDIDAATNWFRVERNEAGHEDKVEFLTYKAAKKDENFPYISGWDDTHDRGMVWVVFQAFHLVALLVGVGLLLKRNPGHLDVDVANDYGIIASAVVTFSVISWLTWQLGGLGPSLVHNLKLGESGERAEVTSTMGTAIALQTAAISLQVATIIFAAIIARM